MVVDSCSNTVHTDTNFKLDFWFYRYEFGMFCEGVKSPIANLKL